MNARPNRGGGQRQSRGNKSTWPVYKIQYHKHGGGTKELRLEWNHCPDETECAQTIAAIQAYINNSERDVDDCTEDVSFNKVQPDYGLITVGPPGPASAKSEPSPDGRAHISVRFASQAQRNQGQGATVHICVDTKTYKYVPEPVDWPRPKPDSEGQRSVYENRTQWPHDASATEAPWALGDHPPQPAGTPATVGLKEAPPPAQSAWSQSLTSSMATPSL